MLKDAFVDFCRQPDCLFGMDFKGGAPRLLSPVSDALSPLASQASGTWERRNGMISPGASVNADGELTNNCFVPVDFRGMTANLTFFWCGRIGEEVKSTYFKGFVFHQSSGGVLQFLMRCDRTQHDYFAFQVYDGSIYWGCGNTYDPPDYSRDVTITGVVSWKDRRLWLYVNGELRNSSSAPDGFTGIVNAQTYSQATAYLRNGSSESSQYCKQVAVFNRPFTAAEVLALHNATGAGGHSW